MAEQNVEQHKNLALVYLFLDLGFLFNIYLSYFGFSGGFAGSFSHVVERDPEVIFYASILILAALFSFIFFRLKRYTASLFCAASPFIFGVVIIFVGILMALLKN